MAEVKNSPVLSRQEWEKLKQQEAIDDIIEKEEGSDWRGLVFKPHNVYFSTQNRGEQVYILLRKHFITNFGWISSTAIYSTFPLILGLVLTLFRVDLFGLFGFRLVFILLAVYYSVLLTGAIRNFVNWYFNLYIVTNERVMDYRFRAFISKSVAESPLEALQDVREISVGFLPSLLNYGDVSMYSAADKTVITFNDVPNPSLVRDKISDLAKIAKNNN